jgi:alpha-mannosidase
MPAPGAQVRDTVHATFVLAVDPADARAGELGLTGVLGDADARLEPERSLFALTPDDLVLSAVKPAADGDGIVVRVLNPTDAPRDAQLTFGFDIADASSVRLDETPDDNVLQHRGRAVRLRVDPHELRTVRVRPA